MMNSKSSINFNFSNFLTALFVPGLLLISACGGGSAEVENVQLASNKAPSVNAGQDQVTMANENVGINASASDSDGTVESYSWTQTSGTNVSLVNPNSATASFTAPETNGESEIQLSFQVTVTDDKGASATDSVSITVKQMDSNLAPSVSAGQDQSVTESTEVSINASASDSDGIIQSYSWIQTTGTMVDLQETDTANLSFTAPSTENLTSIQLVFQVTATDNDGDSSSDSVTITVTEAISNNPPSVDAGQAQTVEEGETVSLQATASDIDGTIQSYSWSQLSGTTVSLNSANASTASFTAPSVDNGQTQSELVFQILVTDNSGATSAASASITVLAPVENQAPGVDAGSDSTAYEQTNIELSAIASDNDGNITSYSWIQTSGNQVTINNPTNATANFDGPLLADPATPETYIFEVTVTDDQQATATDTISIVIQAAASTEGCSLTISPGILFTDSFDQLSADDTLCLNDGIYVQAMDIPSNINVKAVNDGMVEIDGGDTRGEEWTGALVQMKGNNSSVRGLKVYHSSTNSDACSIAGSNNTMKAMSCSHGGSHKHKIPLKIAGSGHLVEGSWFYGEGRYVVQCFGGDNITLRGNVIRWDETVAGEESEPNAAMSNYSCSDMIWENNISIDYGIPETYMVHCGDMCMSTTTSSPNYRVQYLGNMVVNHDPTTGNNKAFRADQKGTTPSSDITIKDFYVRSVNVGIVVNPIYDNVSISECTMTEVSDNGFIEGQSIDCNDGADIQFKYIDGVKTTESLWPWPNEAKIKADMCASDERQSDWCNTDKSLSDYILN
jgi:hypothetical protein